jgi:hypothetical protein
MYSYILDAITDRILKAIPVSVNSSKATIIAAP